MRHGRALVIIVAATALTWVSEPDAHNLAGYVVVAMLALAMGTPPVPVGTASRRGIGKDPGEGHSHDIGRDVRHAVHAHHGVLDASLN